MKETLKTLIRKFKKKPVVIEAFEWKGEIDAEIKEFLKGTNTYTNESKSLVITTLEGDMEASLGDFIIKGVKGELYPCKPDIFWQTYEEVKE
jgi:hypothetical protein